MLTKSKIGFIILLIGFLIPFYVNAQEKTEPLIELEAEPEVEPECEVSFYYTIQKGDTLWDLSRKFSDSPWEWPDLWKKNKGLSNPHWIYPGQKIRLFLKKRKDPRKKAVIQKEEDQGSEAILDRIELAEETEAAPSFYYPSIDSIGFITPVDDIPEPTGHLVSSMITRTMIGEGDLIYIKQTSEYPGIPGDIFTIYRTFGPIREKGKKQIIGVQHYILGMVQIVRKGTEIDTARVIRSFRPIEIGDSLFPYIAKSSRVEIRKSNKGIDGRIIMTEEDQRAFGSDTIAFINKGRSEVETGQYYSIYSKADVITDPLTGGSVQPDPIFFGSLIVLHTEKEVSTVLITESKRALKPGDLISSPRDIRDRILWP
jgi:hypothetical protein